MKPSPLKVHLEELYWEGKNEKENFKKN